MTVRGWVTAACRCCLVVAATASKVVAAEGWADSASGAVGSWEQVLGDVGIAATSQSSGHLDFADFVVEHLLAFVLDQQLAISEAGEAVAESARTNLLDNYLSGAMAVSQQSSPDSVCQSPWRSRPAGKLGRECERCQ